MKLRRPAIDRVFIGVFPGGISFADRDREKDGDYARLAFLEYGSLTLKIERTCPDYLRNYICDRAAEYRVGDRLEISTCGQTVLLGSDILRRQGTAV